MERTTVEGLGRASQPPPQRLAQAPKRVILIANETVVALGVRERIKRLVGGKNAEVYVVAPALTKTRFQQVAGEVDEAIVEARDRLDASVRALREEGIPASGDVGESDPNLALDDALRRFPADEVVISTHPSGRSRWLEQDVVERARAEARVPVTHVVVDMERGGVQVEHFPPAKPDEPATATAYDLPRMPWRDVLAIAVGVVGTVVLGILALVCAGDVSEQGMSAGCALRIGLAIAAFIVTVFHVVGLIFIGSTRSFGRSERFVAYSLLAGIPPAILVSALAG
jgi:hypothetical protein